MSAIIRRRNNSLPAKTMTRQEFLTPFDRIFDDMFGNMFPTLASDFGDDFFTKGSYPKVNVVNYDECIEIDAAIPGMTRDDVDVEITDGVLTIQGAGNQNRVVDDSQYLKREIKRSFVGTECEGATHEFGTSSLGGRKYFKRRKVGRGRFCPFDH